MKVAVSALMLWTGEGFRKAGIGRHIFSTLNELSMWEHGNTYDVFVPEFCDLPEAWTRSPWMTWHRVPFRSPWKRILWEHLEIGRRATSMNAEVLFALHPALPLQPTVPVVSMIHDAFARTHADLYRGPQGRYQDFIQGHACRKCRLIVTVSEWSKAELARAYGISPEKIRVAYNGPGNDVRRMAKAEADAVDLAALGVPFRRFLFTLSTLEPRKNLAGLLEALAILRKQPGMEDLGLAVAGARGWKESPIFERVRELGLVEAVAFLGYVPDEGLPALFARCEAFVFPSFVEGFGIPVLEAMIMGAPVVTSQTSSLPEVAGEVAYYCDPSSRESIASAVGDCLSDPGRDARVAMGVDRSGTFTWRRSAEAIVAAIGEAAKK